MDGMQLNLMRVSLSELSKPANNIVWHAVIKVNLIATTSANNVNYDCDFASLVFIFTTNHLISDGA